MPDYPSIEAVLSSLRPDAPVYCVHPHRLASATREFLTGFPGRVLFAVKANDEPLVLDALYAAGIRDFDCASLDEITRIATRFEDAECYFMSPVRIPGAAQAAFNHYGVRHFMVDDPTGLSPLLDEIEPQDCVIFARMAVHHDSAVEDLSSKFGAQPDAVPPLLQAIREAGAEPALAFNVGSGVRSTAAYTEGLRMAAEVLAQVPFAIRLVDVGGGFPRPYPGFAVPPLHEFFDAISAAGRVLPLVPAGELLAEPGRALCAAGVSTIVRVLQRRDNCLYINDGMYGAFWELRFHGHKQLPTRAFRGATMLGGTLQDFTIFGPTCDSNDRLPEPVRLPKHIAVGDHIEFADMGAYSLSGRTRFNGFFSDQLVVVAP